MADIGVGLLWLVGLGTALGASEGLVRVLLSVGARVHLAAGLLGLLVALGADAPEVTSALVAFFQGSSAVGLGVVLGSNIYNLAGLLGVSALVAGALPLGKHFITLHETTNLVVTGLIGLLLLLPAWHLPLAVIVVLVALAYAWMSARTPGATATDTTASQGGALPTPVNGDGSDLPTGLGKDASHAVSGWSLWLLGGLAAVCVIFIVVGSDVLVAASLYLGPRFHLPASITGTIILAVATSLPNTWAAVSLSRRDLPAAAIATTFSSNTINLVAAVAVPALFLGLRAPTAALAFDLPWLLSMTLLTVILLALRHVLTRAQGTGLLAMYAVFAVLRVGFIR